MRKGEGKLLHDVNFQAMEFCFVFLHLKDFSQTYHGIMRLHLLITVLNLKLYQLLRTQRYCTACLTISNSFVSYFNVWMFPSSHYHYYYSLMTYLLYNSYCAVTGYCASCIIYLKQTARNFQMFQWCAFRDFKHQILNLELCFYTKRNFNLKSQKVK